MKRQEILALQKQLEALGWTFERRTSAKKWVRNDQHSKRFLRLLNWCKTQQPSD